jgi:6-phosphogluconolactonase
MRLALCLLVSSPCLAASVSGYIGTYTSHGGESNRSRGIYSFHWNARSGDLTDIRLAAEAVNPSFLVIAKNGRFLYAVNEGGAKGNTDSVVAFADADAPQPLQNIGFVPSMGTGPCHVALDASGRWLFVANYRSGSLAVFSVRPDGALNEAHQSIQQPATIGIDGGKNLPHAHQMVQSPDGHFVLSIDLGLDKVFVYRFNAVSGLLTENDPPAMELPHGYGPRHLIFSKDTHHVYVLTELTAKLITFNWDASSGTLSRLAETTTLPPNSQGAPSAAELALSRNGKWLYASNRGQSNSIQSFRIEAGVPTSIGSVASGGKTPRFITIDPSGRFLLAANQDSDNIVVFSIDPASGALTRKRGEISVPAPVDVVFTLNSGHSL